jgi:hypothetical protein
MAIAKTKVEEIQEELRAVEKLKRAQGMWRLQTIENRLEDNWARGLIPRPDYVDCLCLIAKLKVDRATLVSLTEEQVCFFGEAGLWDQFFHYAHLGLVHQAYMLVKDTNPIGLSLNFAGWLSIFHGFNFEFVKLEELASAVTKAYPNTTADQKTAQGMVIDGLLLANLFEDDEVTSVTEAIEYALLASIPDEQLRIHGIEYKGGQMPTDYGDQYVLDINYLAPELSIEEICEIDRKFERALMQKLPLSIQSKCCITLVAKDDFYD